MGGCLTDEEQTQYRRGAIETLDEMRRIENHLESCAACRQSLRNAGAGATATLAGKLTPASDESDCPESDALVEYVAGAADAVLVEVIGSHVQDCTPCADRLASLRQFHEEMHSPVRSRAIVREGRGPMPRGLWGWIAASGARLALAATLPVCLFVLIAVIAFQSERQSGLSLRRELMLAQDARRRSDAELATLKARTAQAELDSMRLQHEVASLQANRSKPGSAPAPQLVLQDKSGPVVLFKDGSAAGLPASLKDEVSASLKTGQFHLPVAIVEIRSREGVTMGGHEEGAPFKLLSPIGTAVLFDKLTFRWEPLQGETRYTVHVVDTKSASEATHAFVQAGPQKTRMVEWTPATGQLQPGHVYNWYVVANKNGQDVQSPPGNATARFATLSTKEERLLKQKLQSAGRSHLTQGIVYANAGLVAEAQHELAILAADNPTSSVAKSLLNSLKR